MATVFGPTSAVAADASVQSVPGTGSARWPVWAVLFASTSVMVGVLWDISWRMTIGQDTFCT